MSVFATRHRRRPLCTTALALALTAFAPGASAQTAWPNQPVHMVVPYAPGGTTDYAARQLAQRLSEATGTPFLVENRSGASGTIGNQQVARAAADGYTLLITDTTYAMLPLMFAQLPWNHARDLVHLTNIIETPVVAIVPEASPFQTLPELVAYARANPGRLNFGSGGPASSTHMAAELFKSAAAVDLTHIPYRGAGAALADVMAGRIDLLITASPTAIGPVKGGRVRALAVTGRERLAVLPEVPTFWEVGLPDYQVVNWFGVAAPAGTPGEIAEKFNRLTAEVMADPAMRATLRQQGAAHRPMSVEQTGTYVAHEIARWAEVGKQVGIKPAE